MTTTHRTWADLLLQPPADLLVGWFFRLCGIKSSAAPPPSQVPTAR